MSKEYRFIPWYSKVNEKAKYVFVGITPGNNQKVEEVDDTLANKFKHAFDGMRKNIAEMIECANNINNGLLQELIDVYKEKDEINKLFEYNSESIVDFTSLLKNATYELNGKMFNKPKKIMKEEELNSEYKNGFLNDWIKYYSNDVVFIACGRQVYNVLIRAQRNNEKLGRTTIIPIVHPSGNAQRYIKLYLKGEYPSSGKWEY